MSETSPATPVPGSVLDGESAVQTGDLLRRTMDGLIVCAREMQPDDTLVCVRPLSGEWAGHGVANTFTFIGRPDQDGWIKWSGGENPVGNLHVDVRLRSGQWYSDEPADVLGRWWGGDSEPTQDRVIAFRPHREVSGEGQGSLQPQEAVVPTEQDDDVTSQLLRATIELRERLLAFVGAVAEITDCGPDVEAIKRADAAIAQATGK